MKIETLWVLMLGITRAWIITRFIYNIEDLFYNAMLWLMVVEVIVVVVGIILVVNIKNDIMINKINVIQ